MACESVTGNSLAGEANIWRGGADIAKMIPTILAPPPLIPFFGNGAKPNYRMSEYPPQLQCE
jgi:hypothetical protein